MFELRITDVTSAPAIALGWADKTISLVNTTGICNPMFGPGHKVFVMDDLESVREECHRPGMRHAPTMDDVKEVLAFTETFTDEDKVLIHCHAGLCRSTAFAVLALVQHGATPEEAMDKVIEVRPHAWPNKLIIRLGDIVLEMDWTLMTFMDKWWEDNRDKLTREKDDG